MFVLYGFVGLLISLTPDPGVYEYDCYRHSCLAPPFHHTCWCSNGYNRKVKDSYYSSPWKSALGAVFSVILVGVGLEIMRRHDPKDKKVK